MAKLKIVVKVTMASAKSRARAMVVAAKTNGVVKIEIAGDLKDRVEVTGEGIDITCLVRCLRKKLRCHAEVLKVEEVKEKPPEKKKPPEHCVGVCCPSPCVAYHPTPLVVLGCDQEQPAFACRIM